jgi:hypothetical protein
MARLPVRSRAIQFAVVAAMSLTTAGALEAAPVRATGCQDMARMGAALRLLTRQSQVEHEATLRRGHMAGLCRVYREIRLLSGRIMTIVERDPQRCGLPPATVELMRGTLAHVDSRDVCRNRY